MSYTELWVILKQEFAQIKQNLNATLNCAFSFLRLVRLIGRSLYNIQYHLQ
jgi:hypothetical protein